jgi:hypothetical protein
LILPAVILHAAIEFTMKARKSMKIRDLKSVGRSTCLHLLGDKPNELSVPHLPFPFMSFKCFMVDDLGFHNFNCGI